MLEKVNENVLMLLNTEETEVLNLKIEAKLNEILSYLNRSELTDEMLPSVCVVIAQCLENDNDLSTVQSYKEGDLSVTFSNNSPFFGKLDSFKLVSGAQ